MTVRSMLVEVPILAKTKGGEAVFQLTADDFLLTENGVPLQIALDPDTDSLVAAGNRWVPPLKLA